MQEMRISSLCLDRDLYQNIGLTDAMGKKDIIDNMHEHKEYQQTQVKRFHGRSRVRELHLYKLKVDYISDETTNKERKLKMESVMSSFRLFIDKNTGNVELDILQLNLCMATSIGARQPQSVQGNLNLCRATSICAKQPQSVQNNLNSCKTTSIRAEKKNQKVTAYFRGIK